MLTLLLTLGLALGGELLPNRSFESWEGGLPQNWRTDVGATHGVGGATSEVGWSEDAVDGERSLRLHGSLGVRRWLSVESDPVAVVPGGTLRLSGWMRSEDVRQEGRQFANAYLGLRYEDEGGGRVRVQGSPVVAFGRLQGTTGWHQGAMLAEVPREAARVRVIAFLSMSGTAWFDGVHLSVVEMPEWLLTETEHIRFHAQEGAPIDEEHRARTEAALVRTAEAMGVEPTGDIDLYRYTGVEQKERLTGRGGNAHVNGSVVHTIWPADDHEIVHILARQWGETDTSLLGEGLAVHMSGQWHGRPNHTWVVEYAAAGTLPSLDALVRSFWSHEATITYPVAGSFVDWLVEAHGMDRLREAYVGDGAPAVRLERVYGAPLAELEAAWLAAAGVGGD